MTDHAIPDRHYYDSKYYQGHLERLRKMDRFTKVRVARVRRFLAPAPNERIVDFGCGVGTMMISLVDTGAQFIGVDYSETSLRMARSLYAEFTGKRDFRGMCSAGEQLPLENGSIDGFMAVDFTEHITEEMLRLTLAETFRALRPGGRLLIYTPNPEHLFERLKARNFLLKQDPSHIGLRTMSAYVNAAQHAGFHPVRQEFEPTHIPLYSVAERMLMHLPMVGSLARRRICLLLEKPG